MRRGGKSKKGPKKGLREREPLEGGAADVEKDVSEGDVEDEDEYDEVGWQVRN